jgi:hypothetical protein
MYRSTFESPSAVVPQCALHRVLFPRDMLCPRCAAFVSVCFKMPDYKLDTKLI